LYSLLDVLAAAQVNSSGHWKWLRYWAIRSLFWTQMEEQPYFLVT
jgi:hypothetical protein